MSDAKQIAPGRQVAMHFTLTLEDGFEAETTRGGEPMAFEVGDGTLMPTLEQYLIGLEPGEEKDFLIPPEAGFGFRDETSIHDMPRDQFGADMELAPGVIIGFATPSGEELPGTVLEVGDETVKVDFNHPLAGHTISFSVQIVSVE